MKRITTKHFWSILIAFMLLAFNWGNCFAQHSTNLPRVERLDMSLQRFGQEYNSQGISMCLNLHGDNIWTGTYGYSHDAVKINPNSMINLNLSTSLYTSTIILQLYEEGKLDIYDSIFHYLPAIKNVDSTITIQQLLQWKSGLNHYILSSSLRDSVYKYPDKIWTPLECLNYLELPRSAPGEFGYCATENLLLGMIVESVTGNSFLSELNTRILEPFEFERTFLDPESPLLNEVCHAWNSSSDVSGMLNTKSYISALWTAEGMMSTATEHAKFIHLLYEEKAFIADTSLMKLIEFPTFFLLGVNTGSKCISYYANIETDTLAGVYLMNQSNWSWSDIQALDMEIYTAYINSAPTDIIFSNTSISDTLVPGEIVGEFSTIDEQQHSTFTYSMTYGDLPSFDDDNYCFTLDGNKLIVQCNLDGTLQSQLHIGIKSEDGYGGSIVKPLTIDLEHVTGMEHDKPMERFTLFPNPVSHVLIIRNASTLPEGAVLQLFDISGKIVYEHTLIRNSLQIEIDISMFEEGIYFLRLENSELVQTKKILILH